MHEDNKLKEITDKMLDASRRIGNINRKPHRRYYVTSSQDADYVENWVKRHEVPFNGMYLNKSIYKSIADNVFQTWYDAFDYFSKL